MFDLHGSFGAFFLPLVWSFLTQHSHLWSSNCMVAVWWWATHSWSHVFCFCCASCRHGLYCCPNCFGHCLCYIFIGIWLFICHLCFFVWLLMYFAFESAFVTLPCFIILICWDCLFWVCLLLHFWICLCETFYSWHHVVFIAILKISCLCAYLLLYENDCIYIKCTCLYIQMCTLAVYVHDASWLYYLH